MSGNVHSCKLFKNKILTAPLLILLLLTGIPPLHAAAKPKKSIPVQAPKVEKLKSDLPGEMNQKPASPAQSVTVIGSRLPSFQRNIREVASNVSVVNREDLKFVQPLRFQDAVQDLEGAHFFDTVGNGWDAEFGLRGFRGSSSIAFLVDGVRMNEVDGNAMNFPLISMDDLESIQVERGSASPVYGSNAFAGVVNITTGQFSEKLVKLFGGFEWGSFHSIRFYKGASGTVQDTVTKLGGKFQYYFRGGRNVGKGWRNNSEWRLTSFDMKSAYVLPENQGRFYFNWKRMVTAVSNPGEITFDQFQADERRVNKPLDGKKIQSMIFQVGADKKFWDDHLTASIMHSWRPTTQKLFTTFGTFTDFADGFDPDTNLVTNKSKDRDLIAQLKYENDITNSIYSETQGGLEFQSQTQYALQQDAFNGQIVERTARETERGAHAYNTGLFWRETLTLFDKVIPYFGMRHDFNWLRTEDFLAPGQNISEHWHKTSLSTGVTVTPVSFMDWFFNYSQGFRVPTISEVSPFAGTLSSSLAPEKSHSYETGTRFHFFEDRAAYKTSFFLIDLKDEIAFDSTVIGPAAPFGQNINIGKSRRYGVEQRIDLKPLRELKLYGSYSWIRAYVRETNAGGSPVDGRSLGQIPENRFTVGAQSTPFARLGENFDGFKMGLRGVFTGRQNVQSYESTSQATFDATGGAGHRIKAYSVWDFIASYEWREKTIYFKINNLFDEKYYSRAVDATSFGTSIYPFGTYTFVNPGAPREFVLGARWEI